MHSHVCLCNTSLVLVRCRVILTSGQTKASRENEKQLVKELRKILQQFDKHRLKQYYTNIGIGDIEVFDASRNKGIVIWLLCPSTKDLSHLRMLYLNNDLLKAMQSLFQLTWRLHSEVRCNYVS